MNPCPAPLASLGLAYRYLGWVFYRTPQNHGPVQEMLRDVVVDWVLPDRSEQTLRGLGLLGDCLNNWGPDTPMELQADFNRLFVGPGHLLAPPWESVYRGVDQLLFDQHTLAVRKSYARFGLEAPHQGREPEDHLGLEFLFLAHLCELMCQAQATGDWQEAESLRESMRRFLGEHMTAWMPTCLGLVQQHARTSYYQGQACLALSCLTQATGDL